MSVGSKPTELQLKQELELSRQLTRLIDVLYALVLVQGAIYYRSLFTMSGEFEHPSQCLPVVLCLILVYFTTIQSFIDYHRASEDQPYRLLHTQKRGPDLWRFYLDVVIVGMYSFVLLKCHGLLKNPETNLTLVFFAFTLIFSFYILWGCLRQATGQGSNQSFTTALLCIILIIYGAVSFAYTQITVIDWQVNTEFIFIALCVMVAYRRINWTQSQSYG